MDALFVVSLSLFLSAAIPGFALPAVTNIVLYIISLLRMMTLMMTNLKKVFISSNSTSSVTYALLSQGY